MSHFLRSSRPCRWFATALLCFTAPCFLIGQAVPVAAKQKQEDTRAQNALEQLSLSFEPNVGQFDSSVEFLAHSAGSNIYFTGSDAVISRDAVKADELHHHGVMTERSLVTMHLLNAAKQPAVTAESFLPGRVNYLVGNDRSRWHTNVPTYSGIRLSSVYPGVDLRYYGSAGTLEYDFIVAPQQSADVIRFTFPDGSASLESNGDLSVTAQGFKPLRFKKPLAYQVVNGKHEEVDSRFQLASNSEVSFAFGRYDHSRELVVDPTLVYVGTMGTGVYQINLSQMTVDSSGALYMIGTTSDPTFPVTPSAYQKLCGPTKGNPGQVTYYGGYCPSSGAGEQAAFVAKLSPDGTQLQYATYLSGQSGTEQGISLAVDGAGVAYLLGTTGSNDFPVTSDAFQKNCYAYYGVFGGPNIVPCDGNYNGGGTEYTIGNQDAFFAKLSADGSSLLYSSFLGGTAPVYPNSIGLDATGNIYIAGQVTVWDGSDLTGCTSCGPHSQGQLQYTGLTSSGYMTGSNAIDQYNNPTSINAAAFLSKFSNDGRKLLYGTFFGDNTTAADVIPTTAAVGANGVVFLGGYTQASNFPVTAGALKAACVQRGQNYQGRYCNTFDGFVTAIDTTKSGSSSLIYSTRLGGTSPTQGSNTPDQEVLGLLADTSNNVFVTGYTFESSFTMAKAGYQTACPNNTGNVAPTDPNYLDRCDSAFLLKIDPSGTKLLGGTFFAAPALRSPETVGHAVRVDSRGNVVVYGKGSNYGYGFPTLNPVQNNDQSSNVLFVAAFTPDLDHLLFSTLFGDASHLDHNQNVAGGLALDGADNIYFTGDTTDTDFATTAGTYVTAQTTGAGHHPFFVKLSKVLQPTTTTLTLPSTAGAGRSVVLKAVVTGAYQTLPSATGTVTFTATSKTTAKSVTLGSAFLDSTGTASATVTAPAADTYTVVASYGADGIYDRSTSSSAALTTVTPVSSSVALVSSAPSSSLGAAVTFTATVSATASPLVPTGTVAFYDGSTSMGTGRLSNGTASYTTSSLSPGAHAITAQYSGDSTFAPATSSPVAETVTAATISLTATPTTLTITQGQSGSATITATPVGIFSGVVSFTCGTSIAHTACAFAPASLTFSNAAVPQSTTLTINTNVAGLMMPPMPGRRPGYGEPVEAGLLGTFSLVALLGRKSKKLKPGGTLLLLMISVATISIGLTGCGNGSSGPNGGSPSNVNSTPTGSYTLPVTASVSGSNVTLNLTVNVQ